jgi:archaellum component FlaG (FlaF/FlaG flagellin family)
MKKSKKGALELSVNTIVIIVIGVTLLTLGLIFVRGVFSKINSLSDNVFDNAQSSINEISHTGKFNAPTSIGVQQGAKKTFNVYVSNDGSSGTGQKSFTLSLIPNGNFESSVKAKVISPASVTLDEGKEATYTIQVAAVSTAPLSLDASYQVKVTAGNTDYASGGFSIQIVKSTGLFG